MCTSEYIMNILHT